MGEPASEQQQQRNIIKKKRSPNWLPQEEEQLACSWLKVSEKPEFSSNQTSEDFFRAVELHFNLNCKLHHRDHDQIRIRWAALNTSTLKFSAIYNTLERTGQLASSSSSSSSSSIEEDRNHGQEKEKEKERMAIARKIYSDQSRGHAFKDDLAWQKLRYAHKWKQDHKKSSALHHHLAQQDPTSFEVNQQQHSRTTTTVPGISNHRSQEEEQGECTPASKHIHPSSMTPFNSDHRAKRIKLDQCTIMHHLISRSTAVPKDLSPSPGIPVIPVSRSDPLPKQILPSQTDLNHLETDFHQQPPPSSSSELPHELVDHRIGDEDRALDRELKQSQIDLNHLKLICHSEADCPDHQSIAILRLLKSRLFKRLS
ncbi:hypothetical protein PSTG_12727 [Puccinia striiformis f. sp. tritici PST-78]|uniref:No apical meristem-associated C-terminal domain-containing protein n=1 Tax=Puccinia striiformis f. sp. tritici PST-78 TaxID=1165861 RepID=A0A0L0V3N6_9BASI|nr:hypothetical protein PSTG_12727 [Puccinia striiformis f. sp. tritici PST-78]